MCLVHGMFGTCGQTVGQWTSSTQHPHKGSIYPAFFLNCILSACESENTIMCQTVTDSFRNNLHSDSQFPFLIYLPLPAACSLKKNELTQSTAKSLHHFSYMCLKKMFRRSQFISTHIQKFVSLLEPNQKGPVMNRCDNLSPRLLFII